MRVFAQCAAVGLLTAGVAFSPAISAQPAQTASTKDPAPILAAARQALGGEKKLTAVKSFTATGRARPHRDSTATSGCRIRHRRRPPQPRHRRRPPREEPPLRPGRIRRSRASRP